LTLKKHLKAIRRTWKGAVGKMSLSEIIAAMGVVFGDICRVERDWRCYTGDNLKREFGNMILSTIRWCDDLGFDPDECIEIAMEAQTKFAGALRDMKVEGDR